MTTFRVHCPTCNARLKVKSRKLIGQIVNCPKCGSMVQIDPPETPNAPQKQSKRKGAVAGGAALAAQAEAPVANPPLAASVPPEEMSPQEASADEAVRGTAEASSSSATLFENVDQMLDEPASPTAEDRSSSALPALDDPRFADSSAVSKWRGIALIAGASAMAVVTVAVVGYTLLKDASPTDLAQSEPVPIVEEEPAEPAATDAQPAPESVEEPAEADLPEQRSESVEEPTPPVVAEEVSASDEEDPALSVAEDSDMRPPVEPSIEKGEENPFLFDEPATDAPPKQSAPTTPDAPAAADAQAPAILDLKDDPLYEVFGESFPVFDPEMFEESANASVDVPQGNDDGSLVEAPRTPEPVPPIPDVDVPARLSDPIIRIEFDQMPLDQFASFMTQMSTVPVTLDPLALAYADIDARQPVQVSESQTSVRAVLNAAVRPFGLEVVPSQASARLQIQSPIDGQLRTAQLACDDMAATDKEVAELAYLLTHLVEPQSWNSAGGEGLYRIDPGTISITQNEVAHFKAIVFLEKMRVARGLPTRSQYSPQRFVLEPRAKQVASALAQTIKVQIVVPTPLYKVVGQIEKAGNLTILCDWDSLALNGLGPATPVTLSALNVSVEDALREFGAAWKVAIVPIDATTVQLVSHDGLPQTPWLEFYDVSHLELDRPAASVLINQAQRELADLRATGNGVVHYDPVSRHLLARLSQEDHRRLMFFLERRAAP